MNTLSSAGFLTFNICGANALMKLFKHDKTAELIKMFDEMFFLIVQMFILTPYFMFYGVIIASHDSF